MFSSAFDIWTQTPAPPHPSPLPTPQTSPFHHLFSNVNTNTITPSFVRDTADTLIVCKRVRMGFFGGGEWGLGDGVERCGLEVDGGRAGVFEWREGCSIQGTMCLLMFRNTNLTYSQGSGPENLILVRRVAGVYGMVASTSSSGAQTPAYNSVHQ